MVVRGGGFWFWCIRDGVGLVLVVGWWPSCMIGVVHFSYLELVEQAPEACFDHAVGGWVGGCMYVSK